MGKNSIRILYITAVNIGRIDNGGSLCLREQIKRLSYDPRIECHVITIGNPSDTHEQSIFLSNLCIPHFHLEFDENRIVIEGLTDPIAQKFPFFHEDFAAHYCHIDDDIKKIIASENYDIYIIAYFPTVFYIKSILKSCLPTCIITLNPEWDFMTNYHLSKGIDPKSPEFFLAQQRWREVELNFYNSSSAIISLSENDFPEGLSPLVWRTVIPPFHQPSPCKWRFRANGQIGFVGNICHFPNFQAIEWLCLSLAPELAKLDGTLRIRIVGADESEVPSTWRSSAVTFLGKADQTTVANELTTNDLFIAPIENRFGAKIKLLDCIAHGTPFYATKSALSGLPFIKGIPIIDLNNPSGTAETIDFLLSDQRHLEDLSRSIHNQTLRFESDQSDIWFNTINDILANYFFAKSLDH